MRTGPRFDKPGLCRFCWTALLLSYLVGCCNSSGPKTPKRPVLVCHAGGALNPEQPYRHSTNSLEAITISYERGFRFFELDFSWTSDEKLVLIHDWRNAVARMFRMEPRVLSYQEFVSLPYSFQTTQLTLERLAAWLRERPYAYLVTDIKEHNVRGLKLLRETMPDLMARIVAQIYFFDEYEPVREMGYENILLALYKMGGKDEEILNFARCRGLFAVSMPIARGEGELPGQLAKMGVYTYAHTTNEIDHLQALQDNGVYGIYTDLLFPNVHGQAAGQKPK